MSEARAIVEAIKAAIRADHTIGGGVYDLSGVDRVRIGRYTAPVADAPFVWVASPALSSTAEGARLGHYFKTAVLDVVGYVATADGEVETRVLDAIDLQSDVHAAIEESGRGNGGLFSAVSRFRDVICQGVTFDGDENQLSPGFGVFFSTVTVTYELARGT